VLVACVVGVAVIAGVSWFAIRGDVGPFRASDQCTAEVGDHSVVLDPSQARYAGLITAAQLKAKRRHAILIVFVVAAVLTPPDPISQIALALPTILLYELSIHAVKLAENLDALCVPRVVPLVVGARHSRRL